VDGSGALRPDGFWFMEMNTRLQVEHPVSEMITGLDFVELQFRVASGEKLPDQSEITINGHAVEARLCAEDPARGFLPSSGHLEIFDLSAFADESSGGVTLRLDSAVEEGDTIPATYDSMIAKAIAHGPDRDAALDALSEALREAEVWPVTTNAAMLANLLDNDDFRDGVATTGLVEASIEELTQPDDGEQADALALAAVGMRGLSDEVSGDPWSVADGFRINGAARTSYSFDIGGKTHTVRLETGADGDEHVVLNGEQLESEIETMRLADGVLVHGALEGIDVFGVVRETTDGPVLFHRGRAIALRRPEFGSELEGLAAGDDIRAPMPGKVLDVKAAVGQDVKKGDPMVVLEAMKMEHALTAPRDGKIIEVAAIAGSQTSEGTVLVRFEPIPE
ncbi:MAG: biotin/lipoyl-containing protein, partial [Hyphomonadaceae bacterium]